MRPPSGISTSDARATTVRRWSSERPLNSETSARRRAAWEGRRDESDDDMATSAPACAKLRSGDSRATQGPRAAGKQTLRQPGHGRKTGAATGIFYRRSGLVVRAESAQTIL